MKRYGAMAALAGVDLDIEPGRFVVLLGPSGSGKSTLVRSLAGIERLDSGTVHFDDVLVSDGRHHLPPDRRNLAMVFQDYALWPHLTALGNVAYALRRRRLDRAETQRRAYEALARVGLAQLAGRYPQELSGGEQQRVGLARAIVARPALLLFDEPLSNLDADLRERLRVEIATLTRETGATALYITHDQSEAFALADEIGILHDGRLEQLATPERLYQCPATPFVARFTGMAGQLTAGAIGHRGQYLLVRVGSQQLAVRPVGEIRTGELVSVLIRPAATGLVVADTAITVGTLPGTIVDIAYRGRGYDHVVDCGHGLLTSVFDHDPWPRGTPCGVRLDAAGCSAFPAAESAAGAASTELTAVRLQTKHTAFIPATLEEIHP